MIYAKVKDQEEQKQLDDALDSSKSKKWYRRLQVVANSAKKFTVKQLSIMFAISEATIRSYIQLYNEGGLDKLAPLKQTGRPPKIANWTKEQWSEVLERTPDQYEKLNTHSRAWILERLSLYLKEYHQIEVSIVSIHNSLEKTKIRTGRNKLRVGSNDPDYVVKRAHVEAVQILH